MSGDESAHHSPIVSLHVHTVNRPNNSRIAAISVYAKEFWRISRKGINSFGVFSDDEKYV
jgi:hypothetical protein